MNTSPIDLSSSPPDIQSAEDWSLLFQNILVSMDCCTGTLHRVNPETSMLELVTQVGIPEELMPKVQVIPIGKGIAGAAAERREPVQICNLQTDTSGVARPDAKKTQVAGSLAVPILEGEKLLGTLGVGKRTPHDFDEAETETLGKIAHWLIPLVKP
tara:strand:+ start:4303 stop:4773 length:471 start_codon:yes stop_codon:yes gene_type:complete